MIDRILDIAEVDWSPGFVRWRGWVVLAALAFLPAQTFDVVTTWEQHRLAPVVAWVQHLGDPTPGVQPTTPATTRASGHNGSRKTHRAD
jgi:hypothetical protein